MACLNYTSSPVKFNNKIYDRTALLDKIQKDLEEANKGLTAPIEKDNHRSSEEYDKVSKKLGRYESSEIFAVPSRDTRSANDKAIVRNLSVSQDVMRGKDSDTPRIINSK
jgi:hypothetical protein